MLTKLRPCYSLLSSGKTNLITSFEIPVAFKGDNGNMLQTKCRTLPLNESAQTCEKPKHSKAAVEILLLPQTETNNGRSVLTTLMR